MNKSTIKGTEPGLPPGSLVHVGVATGAPVHLTVFRYDKERLEEETFEAVAGQFPAASGAGVTWINVDGLHEVSLLEAAGRQYEIHPLVLEDILNTSHRPKFEDHDGFLFVTVKMLQYDEQTQRVATEQISFVQKKGVVLSFQESAGDVFAPVRERLRSGRTRIRSGGSDYLVYALLDAIVDHYYVILEKLGGRVATLEELLMDDPSQEHLHEIHHLKGELATIRRSIWPLREAIAGWERSESALIQKSTRPFMRDVYDHTIQVLEIVETQREFLAGLLDLYLSSISNKTNDVMKVLTMIATIFIPLSFIAGLYGMNFDASVSPWNMPELHSPWGYPVVVGLMIIIGGAMLLYFRRKKWL